jgi:PKD repeat protein
MREFSKSLFMAFALFAGLGMIITSCSDETLPVASFTSEATDLAVAFTNTSTDATSYSWDFGDGNTSTDANPSNTYAAAGTYTVTLTATNDDGSDSAEESITVEGAAVLCEDADNTVSPDISYTWATDTGDATADAFFEGFGGYVAERVDNPDQTGNESCYVMKITRGTGCETWGGAGQQLGGRVDFATQPTTITLDVWGAATDVTLVFEKDPFPDTDPKVTQTVNMTKSDEWETLTFDFSGDAGNGDTYGNLILYITRDQGCADEVYYVDNLIQG